MDKSFLISFDLLTLLAGSFVDYLQASQDLWRDAPPLPGRVKSRITWCQWVGIHLQNSPTYFPGDSLFNRISQCYPGDNTPGSSMPGSHNILLPKKICMPTMLLNSPRVQYKHLQIPCNVRCHFSFISAFYIAYGVIRFDGEQQLTPSIGSSKDFKSNPNFQNKCTTAQVG